MNSRTLNQVITEHISDRQETHDMPLSQVDQINAAALDGAGFFDSLSKIGHQTGIFENGPVESAHLFAKLAERHGDPLTELHACPHLAATPAQPGHIHVADPGRVYCRACFGASLLAGSEAMNRYAESSDCDACGQENTNFHEGSVSNGIVTYFVNVCAKCLPPGP